MLKSLILLGQNWKSDFPSNNPTNIGHLLSTTRRLAGQLCGLGSEHMVVGFTTTYVISVYHNKRCEFESCSWRGVLDTRLCDKVVSDLWQVVCFLR